MQIDLPRDLGTALDAIARDVAAAGGRALVVGGTVRDALLGIPAKDLDVEVFGVEPQRLLELLGARFRLDLVGRDFGVVKLRGLPIDVSIPRRESKRGLGHRGFEIHADPHLSLAEAARRRDFTINAMSWEPLGGTLVDPFGGARDLAARRLRHVSEKFVEDPLRVLRGVQLAARFELAADPATVALCRTIDPEGLPHERVFDEWRKLLLRGRVPSRGLDLLRASGWIAHYPELAALVGCPQDPTWHPEGDVWIHTLHVLDAFARQRPDAVEATGDDGLDGDHENLVVGLAALCHDLGKPLTTTLEDGRIRSKRHEEEGVAPTRSFLARLTRQERLVEEVVVLVREHMNPHALYRDAAGPSAIRRLARRVGRIDRLVRVCRADHAGRPPLAGDYPAGEWLLAQADELALADQAPRPLVQGRDLIALGLEPGPHFGPLLEEIFDAQLEGKVTDLESGVAFARRLLAEHGAASPDG